ncbi:MAG TPA: hypothetical protein PK002_04120, partial [Cellvibrio sp.]|nr:hypothetical protein [Cellvibrio sp.]
ACRFNTFVPKGAFTYKTFDIAFSKTIQTGTWVQDSNMTVRLDVLNLFNTFNHDGYENWFGGAGEDLPANFGKPNNSITGSTRTVKLGLNWNW